MIARLLSGLAIFWALASGATRAQERDPAAELTSWIGQYDGQRNAESQGRLTGLVSEILGLDARAVERRTELALVLVDLAGLRPKSARPVRPDDAWLVDGFTAELRMEGHRALGVLLAADGQGAILRALSVEVLAGGERVPLERKLGAALSLRGRHLENSRMALLDAARFGEPCLQREALASLAGWRDESVHRFLAQELERAQEERRTPPPAALAHFERVVLSPHSSARSAVRSYLAHGLLSTDWRTAIQALRVGTALPDEDALPLLIEALGVWAERASTGLGRKRVEGDLTAELQRRTGRRIGLNAERWRRWWKAHGSEAEPEREDDAEEAETRSSFFGLRPVTDRVAFVVDRSGSMEQPFGTGKTSRYRGAVDELLSFARSLGPDARCRVVLFSDEAYASSSALERLDPAGLSRLGAWLRQQSPGGGTYLQKGVELALGVSTRAGFDRQLVDVDTVIVLCDGETTEGRGWIDEFLTRVADPCQLVFHCVQIGGAGDGSLELLARGTRGAYERLSH